MSPNVVADPWQAAFDARPARADEPAGLRAKREAGLQHFRRLGFPTRRIEEWRNTNVSHLARSEWHVSPRPSADEIRQAATLLDHPHASPSARSGRMVFVNGWHVPELSDLESLPVGVHVAALAESTTEVDARLGELVTGEENAFQALNAALWTDGAYVRVARDVELVDPLQLVFLMVGGLSSTQYALEYGQKNYSSWAPPMAPIKIIMCIGIALMLLQTVAIFFKDLAAALGRPISTDTGPAETGT